MNSRAEAGRTPGHRGVTLIVMCTTSAMVIALAMACSDNEKSITTAATVPASRPGPGSRSRQVWNANQPPGFDFITDRPFITKATSANDWTDAEGWSADEYTAHFVIATDSTAPRSPVSVARERLYGGSQGGGAPGGPAIKYFDQAGYQTIYGGFWVKLSPNWQNPTSGATTVLMHLGLAYTNRLRFAVAGNGSGVLKPVVQLSDGAPGGATTLPATVDTAVSTVPGQWQYWEFIAVRNTGGANDGVLQWWVDGSLVGDYRTLAFGSASEPQQWDWFQFYPMFGTSNDIVPQTQSIKLDHVVLNGDTARFAPGPGSPPPPPSVASVTVTPSSSTLQSGQTVQLTATARDKNGNVMSGQSFMWVSSNTSVATVSSSGLVTAGSTAATATITAATGGTSGTASVTVTSPPPPPPPPSARIDTIFMDGFESGSLAGYGDARGTPVIRNDPTFAHSGSRYLDMTDQPGVEDNGWLTQFFMPGYDSVYVRAWVRLSANWTGHTKLFGISGSRTDNMWSAFGTAGHCPTGTDFFATAAVLEPFQGEPAPMDIYTYYPGMPTTGGCYGTNGTEVGAVYYPPRTLSYDVWHKVEMWVKLNTPGQHDGHQMLWLDGRLVGDWPNLVLRTSTILELNSLQLSFNVCCGGATHTQDIYWDDVLVTTGIPPSR